MAKLHLYFWEPTPIFKARVNMPTATYPISEITYDGVTLGAFGDVTFDATLLLGTAEGLDDLGRVRVKSVPDADSIPVARASKGIEDGQLVIQDDAYITILDDYRVWAKVPYFDLDAGIDYKDGDVPPGTFNTNIPPVANTGPGFADFIDSDTEVITVQFPPNGEDLSYAVADGATLTGYAWDIGDGTLVSGSLTDAVITATFPAGKRYVALTVTDSNDVTHTSRCPVLAVDPADNSLIKNFTATQRLTISGQNLDINLFEDAPRTTYPDGTLVLFWWDNPIAPDRRDHMKFIGWLDNESFNLRRTKKGFTRSTQLHAIDGLGRMAKLPGFPQALERIFEEAQWSLMPSLDMSKALFYIAFWHSTLINIVDFFLPVGGEAYDSTRLDANGGNLKSQLENLANKIVPDHFLCCNSQGQVSFLPNWLLQDEGDRPEVDPILIEEDYGDLQGEYDRHPKVHVLRSGAILVHTELVEIDGVDSVPLVFSVAPSDSQAFGQGTGEQVESEGLALSQDALNSCEGHRYAMLNSRHGRYNFTDPRGTLFWVYEPALLKRVQLELASAYAAQRGIDWTVASGQVQEITVNYSASPKGAVIKPSVSWTKETSGYPALTFVPDDSEDVDYEPPPTTPPSSGLILGQDLVAGVAEDGNLYTTEDFTTVSGSGGPTWTETDLGITDAPLTSFVVDPFSPGYINQDGTGTIDGWVVGQQHVWRVTDFFGTPDAEIVYTFSVALGTSSVPEQENRTIQASFGNYFAEGSNPWLAVVSHYRDAAGHTGTWAVHSKDGGVTWSSEVQISSHYDSGVGTDYRPIILYLSPKTPGYAITAAYTATADPAPASGFSSISWGASWTAEPGIDTGVRLGGDIHVPWLASGDDTVYHGKMAGGTATDPALLPIWATMDEDDVLTVNSPGPSVSATVTVSSSTSSLVDESVDIMLAPPKTSKRVAVTWNWECISVESGPGTGGDGSDNFDLFNGSGTSRIGNDDFVSASPNTTTSGSFTTEWSFAGGDWPLNSESIIASPPSSPTGCRLHVYVICSGSTLGGGNTVTHTINVNATITEIELDDGTIYTPVESSTRSFSLQRVTPGSGIEDVSPVSGAVSFGPNNPHFRIRAHDSDVNYMVAALTGNDVSADAADDTQAVFVSDDAAATWTEIVAPVSSAESYAAAFGAENTEELYLWGPAGYISFSDNFGTAIDDRSGNLGTFTPAIFIGIAGGPIE